MEWRSCAALDRPELVNCGLYQMLIVGYHEHAALEKRQALHRARAKTLTVRSGVTRSRGFRYAAACQCDALREDSTTYLYKMILTIVHSFPKEIR